MKKKIGILVIAIIAASAIVILMTNQSIGQLAASNYRQAGGKRWVIGGSLDVESSGEIDMESGSVFKVAGQAITLPTSAGAIMQSTLTTNQVDIANSVWGVSNGLNFEGSSVDDFEATITATDPTVDVSLVIADASSGTIMVSSLATNAPDVLNSVTGASNAIVYEGTADAFETSVVAVDALEDNTITLPEESGSVTLVNIGANVDLDSAASTNNWTVSDTTGWTIVAEGSSNNRAGSNGFELKTDTTDNDELLMDNGSVITSANGANYLGFWMRNEGGTIAATEFDVDLRDSGGSGITNCTELQVPEMAINDWTWVEYDVSTCDLSDLQMFALVADVGITTNTAIDLEKPITYNISNGHGPVRGRLEYHPVSTGTVTRGEFVCAPGIGVDTNGVKTCGANDFAPMGIATNTSTTFVLIQTSGIVIVEIGNATVDNADLDVLSGAVTVDDAGSIENSVGFGMETGNDANDFIYMRLQL